MTGETAAGQTMRKLTALHLVTAVESGRAYITLEGPVSAPLEEIARQMGYSMDDLTQASTDAAARASTAQVQSIDLHGGMFLHDVLPHTPYVPFERRKGGGRWLPPAGLLEDHLVSQEVI